MTRSRSLRNLAVMLLALTACAKLAYEQMNHPDRDVWQQPEAVIQSLQLRSGDHVADLGAGGGYFTFRLAAAVNSEGKVYAVDVHKESLLFIEKEAAEHGGMPPNVELVLATPDDPRLPERRLDLVFVCNTYHHVPDRITYFRNLQRYLRPDGRLAVIEYKDEGWMAAMFGHATAKATVRHEMETAGYRLLQDFPFLARQHFQIFAPAGS